MIHIESNFSWEYSADNSDLINVSHGTGSGNESFTIVAYPNQNQSQWQTVLRFYYAPEEGSPWYAGEVLITIAPNNGNSNGNNNNGSSEVIAPSNLQAQVSGTDVSLFWNYNGYADKFCIYASSSSYGEYEYLGYVYGDDRSCLVENLSSGTYYFKITAISYGTESAFSNTATATISSSGNGSGGSGGSGQTVQKPSAPTGLSAYWDGPAAYPYVILSWSSVSSATNYSVYRATSASGYYSKIGDSSSRTYSDNNVSIGKTYYYKVTASNSAGTSDYSSYTSVTLEDTRKPGPVTYGYCSATSTTITLKWQIPTDSSYGKPTKIVLRLYDPTYNVWVDAQELSGTATSVSFPFGMWVDSDGYVKCGVIPYNEYGSGGGSAKVYDTKNKKWLM